MTTEALINKVNNLAINKNLETCALDLFDKDHTPFQNKLIAMLVANVFGEPQVFHNWGEITLLSAEQSIKNVLVYQFLLPDCIICGSTVTYCITDLIHISMMASFVFGRNPVVMSMEYDQKEQKAYVRIKVDLYDK